MKVPCGPSFLIAGPCWKGTASEGTTTLTTLCSIAGGRYPYRASRKPNKGTAVPTVAGIFELDFGHWPGPWTYVVTRVGGMFNSQAQYPAAPGNTIRRQTRPLRN